MNSNASNKVDVVFVGTVGNTHVCGSFVRAAAQIGITCVEIDTAMAYRGNAVLRRLIWHFGGRRPLHLHAFSNHVRDVVGKHSPRLLLTFGQAPVTGQTILDLRSEGVVSANFSTDDPFNSSVCGRWHRDDLRCYDHVFTPRRANMHDLEQLGGAKVHYLPFGFDADLFYRNQVPEEVGHADPKILFVGGADPDRAAFFEQFMKSGLNPTFVGGYWDRYAHTRKLTIGLQDADTIRRLTETASINICLVRRANRDGHVMRSFEIPAVGGAMVVEDTVEHRAFFGEDGMYVTYFASPEEAANQCQRLLADPVETRRMANALHQHISAAGHTYRDRLQDIVAKCLP